MRVHVDELPEGVALRVGTTASVLAMEGTAGSEGGGSIPPVPSALQ